MLSLQMLYFLLGLLYTVVVNADWMPLPGKNIVTHRKHCKIMPSSQSEPILSPRLLTQQSMEAKLRPAKRARGHFWWASVDVALSVSGHHRQPAVNYKDDSNPSKITTTNVCTCFTLLHKAGQSQKPRSRINKSLWSWAIGIWPRVLALNLCSAK